MAFEYQFLDSDKNPLSLDMIDKEICNATNTTYSDSDYSSAYIYFCFTCRGYGIDQYRKTNIDIWEINWSEEFKEWLKNTKDCNLKKYLLMKNFLTKYTFYVLRYF